MKEDSRISVQMFSPATRDDTGQTLAIFSFWHLKDLALHSTLHSLFILIRRHRKLLGQNKDKIRMWEN